MQDTPERFETNPRYPMPGVYFEERALREQRPFRTGQPAFIGLRQGALRWDTDHSLQVHWLADWEQFGLKVGQPEEGGFLAGAVRGFFENGGK